MHLSTIAAGATGCGEVLNQSHVEKNTLFAYLERLKAIGWITQERPFEEHDSRRTIYRLADNMLKGWYRYVFRNRSALQTWRPADAWSRFVEPDLSTYMGFHVFEGVCHEHLRRLASRYSLRGILEMGRWWTRDHQTEIDLVARLADGSYLFGECKWASSPVLTGDLNKLYRKVEAVPHSKWKESARYVLFSAGEFDPLLVEVARRENVLLIDGKDSSRIWASPSSRKAAVQPATNLRVMRLRYPIGQVHAVVNVSLYGAAVAYSVS